MIGHPLDPLARRPSPSPDRAGEPTGSHPVGRRESVGRFVSEVASFVRLAHVQGTRLVDVLERWVEAAEDHNRQQARLADAAERLARAFDGGATDG